MVLIYFIDDCVVGGRCGESVAWGMGKTTEGRPRFGGKKFKIEIDLLDLAGRNSK
jgi:hypothetical protein